MLISEDMSEFKGMPGILMSLLNASVLPVAWVELALPVER